jgi:hypothetical protein
MMSSNRRLAVVDTTATIVFFTCVAAATELLIAGMTPREVLVTRLVMVPVMILTGRPYGLWRDQIFACISPQGALGRAICDIGAFLSFQVPVYAATLLIAGADGTEMVTAIGSAVVFMVILSRPFGLFLDAARRVAG